MTYEDGVPCALMRGGTSKGAYFLAQDLPADEAARDRLLLSVMGSPDPRQIDGIGGGHPLTSKVAVVGPPSRPDCDVDYLFLQVVPDQPVVSAAQNCGNILAGVGAFAIERGLVAGDPGTTTVRVHMVNSASLAELVVATPVGRPVYAGDTAINGVPGRHAAVVQNFLDVAGSQCGLLLPTGRSVDEVAGVSCTLIDNGMPVVVLAADAVGVAGTETPEVLEANPDLTARVEAIRLEAGVRMGLGDVADQTVPKVALVSPPRQGGMIATRSFIPRKVHQSIGVLAGVTVATACLLPGTPAARLARTGPGPVHRGRIEHPTGALDVEIEVAPDAGTVSVVRSAIVRTARKLFDGRVFPSPTRTLSS